MIWFYLFSVVMLATGEPATTFGRPFPTEEACNAAGAEFAKSVSTDDAAKQAGWLCMPIDFDVVDPAPKKDATRAPHQDEI